MIFKLKQILFAIAYRLDQLLPARLCVAMRNRCLPWGAPALDVVEIHIADHCNLNCTACLHFTPLAAKWFADVASVARDLALLRSKFRYIRHITILGGEPLLNPDYEEIVAAVRKVSPESLVTIVTNGVALRGGGLEKFLAICAKYSIRVKWTCYPPMRQYRRKFVEAFKRAKVPMFIVEAAEFYVKMNPSGGNARKAMKFCRKTTYCPYLRDGRLYTCAQAFHIRDYIRAWEAQTQTRTAMARSAGLDLGNPAFGGWEILEYLMTPCETCRFCSDGARLIEWSQGVKSVKDWVR